MQAAPKTGPAFEFLTSADPVAYPEAVSFMEERVAQVRAGTAPETLWLLEHPPLYTAGTSAKAQDLVDARFPVFQTGRGGQYTYHGPGQRVGYVMLDLQARGGDIRQYVCDLEDWLIKTLAEFGISGQRKPGMTGIWVKNGVSEAKIAAIGVRFRRGVTYHGVSLNINPDLSHFSGIIPCGIREFGVTSMAELGLRPASAKVDEVLRKHLISIFGII